MFEKKDNPINAVLEEYEKTEGILHEEINRIEYDPRGNTQNEEALMGAYDSLQRSLSKPSCHRECEDRCLIIDSLPFSSIEELISMKTSAVQKKTAMKLLQNVQRYSKKAGTQDAASGVNFDGGLSLETRSMSLRLSEQEEQIEQLQEDLKLATQRFERQLGIAAKAKIETTKEIQRASNFELKVESLSQDFKALEEKHSSHFKQLQALKKENKSNMDAI